MFGDRHTYCWVLVVACVAGCSDTSGSGEQNGGTSDGQVRVSAIEPSQGSARGGERVTIRGQNFGAPVSVRFGQFEATSVQVVSDSELVVITPKQTAGTVPVEVHVRNREAIGTPWTYEYLPLTLSFRPAATWTIPSLPHAPSDVVVARFDADRFDDILLVMNDHPAIVLLNDGTGVFTNPDQTTIPGTSGPTPDRLPVGGRMWNYSTAKAIAADLNGDGNTDIVLCNRDGQSHQAMINNGHAVFSRVPGAFPTTNDRCMDAQWVDIDADGISDLVVLGKHPVDESKTILRAYKRTADANAIAFRVTDALESPSEPGAPCEGVEGTMSLKNMTGTMVVENRDASTMHCKLSFEKAADTGSTVSLVRRLPEFAEIPEAFLFDLQSAAIRPFHIRLTLQDSEEERFAKFVEVKPGSWNRFRVGNFDTWPCLKKYKDGKLTAPLKQLELELLIGDIRGHVELDNIVMHTATVGDLLVEDFERKNYFYAWNEQITSMVTGDLDLNDRADVLLATAANGGQAAAVRYLRNLPQTSAYFREENSESLRAISATVNAMALWDGDGDGDLDLVLGTSLQDRHLSNDGGARFTDDTDTTWPLDRAVARSIELADLDLDGRPDLVIGNAWPQRNRVYLGQGMNKVLDKTNVLPASSLATTKLVPIDVDGDGDLDLLEIGEKPPYIVLWISDEPRRQ